MNRFFWLLYQPYKWLVMIPYLFISTLIFGSIAATLALTVNPRIASFIGGVIWARLLCYLTPLRIIVKGRENVNPDQSYVIISNHQSHYDILVLYGWLGVDFRWVMKQELRKVPGLGIGCEKIGHIFIDRSRREAALASINAAKKNIVNGTSVLFFPEGTRQKHGTVGPFKKGAFRFALDMGLPILPITLEGTGKILPRDTIDLTPGRVTVTMHPPIDTSVYDEHSIEELMKKASEVFRKTIVKNH